MSDAILLRLSAIEARLAALESRGPQAAGRGPGAIADDRELDSDKGNPTIRRDPKRWLSNGGASFVGARYSECPADYLDEVAGFNEWAADKNERTLAADDPKRKYIDYDRRDAARARGWAARIRAGYVATPSAGPAKRMIDADSFDAAAFGDDSDLPF
jgi:hypothetical protein